MLSSPAAELFALQDPSYKAFHCRLIPTVDPETVIGVRTPALRRFARDFAKAPEAASFLQQLPHTYYEENNLHALLLERIKDYDEAVRALDAFLPYVNNWATCDFFRLAAFRRRPPQLLPQIRRWLATDRCYTVRFAIRMLMDLYLDEAFDPAYPALVAGLRSDEYYVNMMQAWYFATALAKQYDAILPFLEEHRLPPVVQQMTIRKAVESFRISPEQKEQIRQTAGPKQ